MIDNWTHQLAFAVRFTHHFMGCAVPDELPVRLASSLIRPVTNSAGGYRHTDGTYRFIDLAPGVHRVLWQPPFSNFHRGWTSWDPPLEVALPLADPVAPIERDLWPTPESRVPPGVTAVRGKLIGSATVNQEVRVLETPYRTRTDGFGEFLFLLPLRLPLTEDNTVALTMAVTGQTLAEPSSTDTFWGPAFEISPSVVTRAVFCVM